MTSPGPLRELVVIGASAGGVLARLLGGPAGLICPDCGNALSLLSPDEASMHCEGGHCWSADALLTTNDHEMQVALWTAVRTLDDKTALARSAAARKGEVG